MGYDGKGPTLQSSWQEALNELPICVPLSAWTGHIPFMFLLVNLAKPRTFVELGVDLGASFLAACEAAKRFEADTRCVGVDTWRGDKHADYDDGDGIFAPLQEFVTARYPSCALLRQTFDQAVAQFADRSVDLLHIDGLHTYEAVAHDFTTWLPKLSDRAIVLFHDTEVRTLDFGVYKFWAEIKATYRHFEFRHCYGLGVLLVGDSIPPKMEALVAYLAADADHASLFQHVCESTALDLQRRMRERGPPVINEIALLSRLAVLHKSILNAPPPKPSRNGPCYCGSGRRFKHCHGQIV